MALFYDKHVCRIFLYNLNNDINADELVQIIKSDCHYLTEKKINDRIQNIKYLCDKYNISNNLKITPSDSCDEGLEELFVKVAQELNILERNKKEMSKNERRIPKRITFIDNDEDIMIKHLIEDGEDADSLIKKLKGRVDVTFYFRTEERIDEIVEIIKDINPDIALRIMSETNVDLDKIKVVLNEVVK